MNLDEFRCLRDEHGLERYAESVEAHRARLERLQDPEALRASFVAEWERLDAMEIDELSKQIAQKQLKERARDALSLARAAIAYERGEIERVTALYYELKREINRRKTA